MHILRFILGLLCSAVVVSMLVYTSRNAVKMRALMPLFCVIECAMIILANRLIFS